MSLNDVRRHHQSSVAIERRRRQLRRRGHVARPGHRRAEHRRRDADAARRRVRELPEPLRRDRVGRHGRARRRHVPLAVAREQQPRQRRVAAVERARPPDDRLVLRARQRDVGEPQVLAALLLEVLLHVARPLRALEPDVDRPRPRGVVEGDGLLRVARDPRRLPEVRVVDDRELEPLAAVHGQHLHRLGVALQPPAALLVVVVGRRLEHALAQPRRQRGRAHLLGHRRGVEQLADVPEVGHPPLAVDHREHARRQPLLQRDRLHQRRDALHAQHARPVMQPPVHVLPGVVVGGRDLLGRPAEDRGQRGRAGARRVGGALDRLEQAQPLARGLGAEHAAGAVDDGGDVDRLQRVADAGGVAVRARPARRCGRGGSGPRRRSRRPSAATRRCPPRRRRRRAAARARAARSPSRVRPTSSRGTTRIRSGAVSGAPCRRASRFAAR